MSAPESHTSADEALSGLMSAVIGGPEYARLIAATAAGESLVLPPLNADLIEILGRPNFTCIQIAQLLRLGGVVIARKAGAEQATVIHYLLGFYLKHGSRWAEKANEDLEQRRLAVVAAQQSPRKEA